MTRDQRATTTFVVIGAIARWRSRAIVLRCSPVSLARYRALLPDTLSEEVCRALNEAAPSSLVIVWCDYAVTVRPHRVAERFLRQPGMLTTFVAGPPHTIQQVEARLHRAARGLGALRLVPPPSG